MTLISKHWWDQAKLRWKATSPDFFKKLRIIAVWIFTLACVAEGTLFYLQSQGLDIPDLLKYICSGIVGAGLSAGLVSKLPVYKPEEHGIQDQNPPVE